MTMMTVWIGIPRDSKINIYQRIAKARFEKFDEVPDTLIKMTEELFAEYYEDEFAPLFNDNWLIIDGEFPKHYRWFCGTLHVSEIEPLYELLKQHFGKNFCLISQY